MKGDEINEDSNSFLSSSNMPLSKRQVSQRKAQKMGISIQQKIDDVSYQIIEQLSLITSLEIHPCKFYDSIQIYLYQRKLPSVIDPQFNKKEIKQKADFILSLTSLFRKSFNNLHNKFVIVLPTGGIIYYFTEEDKDQPRLYIGCMHAQFTAYFERQEIKYKEIKLNQYQKESIILEGQYIKIFYGFLLNWILAKKYNIDAYANYTFDFAFKDAPLVQKHTQSRKQHQHLTIKQQTMFGEKQGKLYNIKFQSIWFKDDIRKLDERVKEFQIQYQRRNRGCKITHDYQFKFNKYSRGLNHEIIEKIQRFSHQNPKKL